MKLKKDAWQVSSEIQSRAYNAANSALQNGFGYNNNAMQPLQTAITQAIAVAVAEGFRVMMENQYTDEDFERDLTLSP